MVVGWRRRKAAGYRRRHQRDSKHGLYLDVEEAVYIEGTQIAAFPTKALELTGKMVLEHKGNGTDCPVRRTNARRQSTAELLQRLQLDTRLELHKTYTVNPASVVVPRAVEIKKHQKSHALTYTITDISIRDIQRVEERLQMCSQWQCHRKSTIGH